VIEMKTTKKLLQVALAVGVAVAVAGPGVAMAAPPTKVLASLARPRLAAGVAAGVKTAAGSTGVNTVANVAANQAARLQLLKDRIVLALQVRKARFDFAADRISINIARAASVAAIVRSHGGDVSGVTSKLDTARSALATAKSAEAQAVTLFHAVPSATDKKVAWQAAVAQGRTAANDLKTARQDLKDAVQTLRSIIQSLKASAAGSAASTTGTNQ
jgi:hypothetical protein